MPKIQKNKANEIKASNKTIKDYFVKQTECNKDSTAPVLETPSNEFYKTCLASKILSCEPDKNCHEEKSRLQEKIALLKQKFEQIDIAKSTAWRICQKKFSEIEQLEAEVQSQIRLTATVPITVPTSGQDNKKILFEEFRRDFSNTNLSKLRSIDGSRKADSNFILNAVRSLYSDDLSKLMGKTVKVPGLILEYQNFECINL